MPNKLSILLVSVIRHRGWHQPHSHAILVRPHFYPDSSTNLIISHASVAGGCYLPQRGPFAYAVCVGDASAGGGAGAEQEGGVGAGSAAPAPSATTPPSTAAPPSPAIHSGIRDAFRPGSLDSSAITLKEYVSVQYEYRISREMALSGSGWLPHHSTHLAR